MSKEIFILKSKDKIVEIWSASRKEKLMQEFGLSSEQLLELRKKNNKW